MQMTKEEASKAGVKERRRYFRITPGKANLWLPPENTEWRELKSFAFNNGGDGLPGDEVGVATKWEWPDPTANISANDLRKAQDAVAACGPWHENSQASNLVGKPIAEALGVNLKDPADKEKVIDLLKIWMDNKMFVAVTGQDSQRKTKSFIEVGERAI
jgi:hypothetical protein